MIQNNYLEEYQKKNNCQQNNGNLKNNWFKKDLYLMKENLMNK